MKLPSVRFTVRELMKSIAFIAVILGTLRLRERYEFCHHWAEGCANQETFCLSNVASNEAIAIIMERWAENLPAKLEEGQLSNDAVKPLDKNEQPASQDHRTSSVDYRQIAKQWQRRANKAAVRRRLYEQASLRPWMAIPREPPTPPPWDE
jgi:hypothetical protein